MGVYERRSKYLPSWLGVMRLDERGTRTTRLVLRASYYRALCGRTSIAGSRDTKLRGKLRWDPPAVGFVLSKRKYCAHATIRRFVDHLLGFSCRMEMGKCHSRNYLVDELIALPFHPVYDDDDDAAFF